MAIFELMREIIIEDEQNHGYKGYSGYYADTIKESEVTAKAPEMAGIESNTNLNMRKCSKYCREPLGNLCCDLSVKPDYVRLSESDLNDMVPDLCLPAALLLHAIQTVKTCSQEDFESMCRRFVPHWRKRLDPEAWVIVGAEIKTRLADSQGWRSI